MKELEDNRAFELLDFDLEAPKPRRLASRRTVQSMGRIKAHVLSTAARPPLFARSAPRYSVLNYAANSDS